MKHNKLLSVLLALVLALSLAIPGFAADEENAGNSLTRGDFIAALFIQCGTLGDDATQDYFDDTPAEGALAQAVRWAADSGIVNGYGRRRLGPDDPVTREQMAAMLYRYAQTAGLGFTGMWYFPLDYADAAEVSAWADEAMHWVVMNEIITGTDKCLEPKALVTGADFELILDRFLQVISVPSKGLWIAEGIFTDDDGCMLSITWMDDVDEPGWYVGFMNGEDYIEDAWNGLLLPEEISLKGTLESAGSKEPINVTVTETGAVGIRLEIEDGDTYVFTPMDVEAPACTVTISVDGVGRIAYASEGEELDLDGERFTFHSIPLSEPATLTIGAKADEDGWSFIKWTLNGEDYSTDEIITAEIAEDSEFVAVFAWVAGDGQNPVMNFIGNYQCDRARALVECIGDDGAQITIEWGGSAWELARWEIIGVLDTETLTVEYSACRKTVVTCDDAGAVVSEEVEYEDGSGTIVFGADLTFTWHEEGAEREDMIFEWAPAET